MVLNNLDFEVPSEFPTLDELIMRTPELKREDVEYLQSWMMKQPHLPIVPDENLVSFLHACHYSLERTKVMIDKHFTIRTHAPEIFGNKDMLDPENQKQIQLFQVGLFRRTTSAGYFVSGGNILLHVDPSDYIFDAGVKLAIMGVDIVVRIYPTCPGHILILDTRGVTMGHVARAGLGTIRRLFTYAQAGLNLRIKEIHIIHVTPIIDYILAWVKPFLGKELADLLHFHSGEMEEFYKQFPRDILPKEYGGTLNTMEDMHDYTIWRMNRDREWLLKEGTYTVDESRRPGKATSVEDLFGTQGSFKKLEID